MNKEDESERITVLLFRNQAPHVIESEREERTEEVEDDRVPAFHSQLQAMVRQLLISSELTTLDVVITSRPRRAYQLADTLAKSSLQSQDTKRKREARQHIEGQIDISGVVLNDGDQPVLVLPDLNDKVITQLADAVRELPHQSRLLIVLDKNNLQSFARKLADDNALEVDLDFGHGIKIILGKENHVEKIR